MLDFEPDMKRIKPDIFIVNHDGHTIDKETLCKKMGVEYIVLERIPEPGLPARSSSGTKREMRFPYRLCLAGGWIDQPWVSEIHPGSVVVAQIWPIMDFNDRSGMATSSRKVGIRFGATGILTEIMNKMQKCFLVLKILPGKSISQVHRTIWAYCFRA